MAGPPDHQSIFLYFQNFSLLQSFPGFNLQIWDNSVTHTMTGPAVHMWANSAAVLEPIPLDPVRLASAERSAIRPSEHKATIHRLTPMPRPLLLASNSAIRLQLLRAAGLQVTAHPARIDETTIRDGLIADNASPRDIADTLAEMKARKLSRQHPEALVLGCDQVLEFAGQVWGKPATLAEARLQLETLRGTSHQLLSAAVLYDGTQPVWRHVAVARLTMHPVSDDYLNSYLDRSWPDVASSVGGYKLESEGVRLFSEITGDYFTILGLPLLPLLTYLGQRGFIPA